MPFLKRPRVFLVTGLVLMLIGAVDPLEGSVVIVAGSVIAAVGAWLSAAPGRTLQYWAMAMIALGVATMFGWSSIGGVGGDSGRSIWWILTLVPYPIGWILGLTATARMLRRPPETTAHA